MNIYVKGDIELLEALGKRLERNGFICDGADDRETDSMQISEKWFQYKTLKDKILFDGILPEDWDKFKDLKPKPEWTVRKSGQNHIVSCGKDWITKFNEGGFDKELSYREAEVIASALNSLEP